MKQQSIELSKLVASKSNVRSTYSAEGIKELVASIKSHGLMQNLVVKRAGASGSFEVVSGNRRLVALQQLLKDKLFTAGTLIPCQVLESESPEELSLAENIVREAMHPADEFEAFSALAKDKTMTSDKIALRFGCDRKHVEKRLLLGRVAPELMKLFRDGKLKLESLMAFTITDDQKRQLAVHKGLSSWEKDSPRAIREKLTDKMIDADSAKAKFVTEAAYKKAGGTIKTDMFEEEKYFENTQLVEKLYKEKVDATITKFKNEGWGFVEFGDGDYGYNFRSKYDGIDKAPKKADLANGGVYICIDHQGKLDTYMLMKRKGQKDSPAATKKKEAGGLSQALRDDLAASRMEIAQLNIANNPKLAFDLLVYQVADRLDSMGYDGGYYADIDFKVHTPTQNVTKEKTLSAIKLKELRGKLPLSWKLAKSESERFAAFQTLLPEDKMQLLAFAFGRTIRPHFTGKQSKNDLFDIAFDKIDCVPALLWRPTKDNYLSRITTADLNAIGKELFGKDWRDQNGKAGLVKYLHEIFADPKKAAKGSLELQERIEAWLPKGFGFTLLSDEQKKKAA